MMQHKLLTLLIFAGLGAVQAAELGDVAPRSYIGQPLAADIELLALTPDELANLQVRLADVNVYRGANVAMNPALATVRLQVERRGQKPVLHVTTTQPVAADYVHVYMRLGVPGKQDVRLATVWLQPDPNPAPPPTPTPMPTPAVPVAIALTSAQAEQIAAQARVERVAAGREAAAKEAAGREAAARDAAAREAAAKQAAEEAARQASAAAARDRSKPAPLPSMHEAETGVPGEVKAAAAARRIAGVWVSADGKPTRAPTSEDAPAVPVGVAQALLPLSPLPLPKGVKRPAAACAPTGMSAKACVALDAHNAELSSKLTELEGKMKALQGALGGAAPAGLATAAAGIATATAAVPPKGAQAAAPTSAAAGHGGSAAKGAVPAPVPAVTAAAAAGKATSAPAAAASGAAVGAASAVTSATASLSARAEPEAHAAKAAVDGGAVAASGEAMASGGAAAALSSSASAASASAASAASAAAPAAPPVATKQIRVLPKLKYKKEKSAAPQTNYTLPITAAVGLLALLGGGWFWWRKKKSGKGPLKIWQGFRKKKPAEPGPEDFVEVNTAA